MPHYMNIIGIIFHQFDESAIRGRWEQLCVWIIYSSMEHTNAKSIEDEFTFLR